MGIGTALLRYFLEESKSKGAKRVRLNTHPNLKDAIRLYEKEGFVQEGYLIIYGKSV